MKKIGVLLLALMLPFVAWADGEPEADTFLWKVSKSGRPDSYLLGTLHIGRVGSSLPAAYQNALNKAGQLVVESNADELSQSQYSADTAKIMQLMSDSRTLNQSLGRIRMFTLDKVLNVGNDEILVNGNRKVKPWVLWISAQSFYSPPGYSYHYGIDNLLIQQAKKQKKPIISLERAEPMYLLNAIPEDKIKRSFDWLIAEHQEFLNEQKKSVEIYRANHARLLWQEVADPKNQLQFFPLKDRAFWQKFMYQQLLTDRNQSWLPKLVDQFPRQPTLVAVGAAHLFGKQGLIWRLRQAGYQVAPVLPAH